MSVPSTVRKAQIRRELRRGDIVRVAEIAGTDRHYAKKIINQRPTAKSEIAQRVWRVADRLLSDRSRLKAQFYP